MGFQSNRKVLERNLCGYVQNSFHLCRSCRFCWGLEVLNEKKNIANTKEATSTSQYFANAWVCIVAIISAYFANYQNVKCGPNAHESEFKKQNIAMTYTLTSCIWWSSSRESNNSFAAPSEPGLSPMIAPQQSSNSAEKSGVLHENPSIFHTGAGCDGEGLGDERSPLTIHDCRHELLDHVCPVSQQLHRFWRRPP